MRIEPLAQHPQRRRELAQLLHAEWGAFPPWASVDDIVARFTSASSGALFPIAFVALAPDAQLLGCACIKLNELSSQPDKQYWLGEVFIRPTQRGQGIGSALIRASIDYAFNHGVECLYLYTPNQQALYRRFGWRDLHQMQVNGESVTIMCLESNKY